MLLNSLQSKLQSSHDRNVLLSRSTQIRKEELSHDRTRLLELRGADTPIGGRKGRPS